jgi:hypothetical protein
VTGLQRADFEEKFAALTGQEYRPAAAAGEDD